MKLVNYFKTTRFRTTLWYSAIFLLLEIVIGFIIYYYLQSAMLKQLDKSLLKQADLIYDFVSDSKVDLNDFKSDSIYSSADELVYDLIFEAVAFNPTNTFIQVKFKNKIFFRTSNLSHNEIKIPGFKGKNFELITFTDTLLSKHPIRAAHLKKNNYEIIVAFPDYLIKETLNSLTDIYIIIAPVFFLLSLAGGALISFRALSRIDKIIKKTNEITTYNLNEIIEGEKFDDEYGRLVKTINQMIKRIKTSIEYMNQFSIAAAHEMKTPLTILRGEIELALKSDKTPEQYKEVLISNYEETLHLSKIIDQLFLLTRLDNSIIKIEKINFDIVKLFEETINTFTKFAQAKKIKFCTNLNTRANYNIKADRDLIKQVIINLLDNAVKYGKDNSEIIIECTSIDNNKTLINISNQSNPIPDEILPKLFERFYKTETSRNRNFGGIGLGLSLVKSIIDLHGGNINATYSNNGFLNISIIL